jgi:hypothetical protein
MRLSTLVRAVTPVLALTLLIGCSDAGSNGPDGGPMLTETGFYPSLSVSTSPEQSTITLSLKQVPGGIELASVQGELEYDAAVLQLGRATLPEGVEGDVFEVSPGRVRCVGPMMQAAAEAPLLHLEFRGRGQPVVPAREMFGVRFEEVTGGADLADLTAAVRTDRLLFVRNQ